jgi:hypothetical protein
MKTLLFLLGACLLGGCVSKSKSQAQMFEAYTIGQREALRQQQTASVTVSGEVKNHSIPWTPELTLARALAAAEYQGLWEPRQILISRNGQVFTVNVKGLLNGLDDPVLEAGDQIEVRR